MKHMLFIIAFFSTIAILPMEHFRTTPTKEEIEAAFSCFPVKCNKQCSFLANIMRDCRSKCLLEEQERMRNFLIRKYTASCRGLPSQEQFNFKPTENEKALELKETNRAYMIMRINSSIETCVDAHMHILNARLKISDCTLYY